MIWTLILAVLGMLSGFALHQLYINWKANKLLRKASPLHLGIAVDKLGYLCNRYVVLVDEANKAMTIRTSVPNFLVSSHVIYGTFAVRMMITSLSSLYLIPGHAEYQLRGLQYWLKEICPQLQIVAAFSRDASNIQELQTEENTSVITTWKQTAADVVSVLEGIRVTIQEGLEA